MTETELALSTRIATLEGKVDALCLLFGGQRIAVPSGAVAPNGDAVETGRLSTIPPEIHEVVKQMGRGNRQLTRHLYSVALAMLSDELEPAVIVRKIRDGERVD